MDRLVLSDAAPLICLARINGLPWLGSLFGRIDITQEVLEEIITGGEKPGEKELARAIEDGLLRVHPDWNWPEWQFPALGKGEASCIRAAINLIQEGNECLILIDDREARRLALSFSEITITGTAAVVAAAKQTGLIVSANTVFGRLREKGYRISDEIIDAVLETLGEEKTVGAKRVRKLTSKGKKPRRTSRPKNRE